MFEHLTQLLENWKTISIGLTGIFGMIGLLTEFKNKHTHKITRWGWVSLVGIILSSVGGVAAQLKESSDESAKELAVLNDIDRTLHPIEDPTVTVGLIVDCQGATFQKFCLHANQGVGLGLTSSEWVGWPDADVSVIVDLYKDRVRNQEFIPTNKDGPDLEFLVYADLKKDDSKLTASVPSNGGSVISMKDVVPQTLKNDGQIKSMLDFHGVTVIIRSNFILVDQNLFRVAYFILRTKDGQEVSTIGLNSDFYHIAEKKGDLHVFHFPEKEK